MTDTDPLTPIIAKIDRTIRLLEAAISEKTESPRTDTRLALEELKSTRERLAEMAGLAEKPKTTDA